MADTEHPRGFLKDAAFTYAQWNVVIQYRPSTRDDMVMLLSNVGTNDYYL